MTISVVCRAMRLSDIAAVIEIQAEAYVDEMLETAEVIAARFHAAPDTAWVAEYADKVCGYLVCYQSMLGEVTPWGEAFVHKPKANTLYLHDLAIGKNAIGLGVGRALVDCALSYARQCSLQSAALVAVQNSKSFWQKFGFNEYNHLVMAQLQHLTSYTGSAFYMTRSLSDSL